MGITIESLQIENTKRVKAVSLTPAPTGLTVIGGRNGQGKTSVLDAIAWALGGSRFQPSTPAREGSVLPPHLKVTLSNGIVVERRGKGSALTVTDPSGRRAGQKLLDSFISSFALDLPRFLGQNDRDKTNTLLQIIGVKEQLSNLDNEIQSAYNQRTVIGRQAQQKKKYAEELPYWDGLPETPVSASELIQQQQAILARNGENQRKRQQLALLEARKDNIANQVAAARQQLEALEADLTAITKDVETARLSAADLQDESTAELERNLRDVEALNIKIRANMDKERALQEAESLTSDYQAKTDQLAQLRKDRMDLLNGADLPLPELGVDEDYRLTYHGKAWDCMSGSEQLRVGTAIVRRLQPECGFVLLDKLEQMDADTLNAFGAWLQAEGMQAIATRVSTGDECTILIEDGEAVASVPTVQPARTTFNDWRGGF